MNVLTTSSNAPCVDNIYKERNRLKQEREQIQNNIRKTINSTEEQIQKLKNKIDVLENKKKHLLLNLTKNAIKMTELEVLRLLKVKEYHHLRRCYHLNQE